MGVPDRGPEYERPPGVDDATVEAVGTLSEAFEWLERARGCLYDFHQMMGHVDIEMGRASEQLKNAGHASMAELVEQQVVGRNVLQGRWTFQVVDEFDACYYGPVSAVERSVREELMQGRRHVFEAEMKRREQSGRSGDGSGGGAKRRT